MAALAGSTGDRAAAGVALNMDTEDAFDVIVQRAIDEMTAIDCPLDEYLRALKSARSRFADLVQMVEREIAAS